MDIKVNFHSSIIIDDKIFFDPLQLAENYDAKYIFITHSHWDHYSPKDINKILAPQTKIICPLSMKKEILPQYLNQTFFVEPNKKYNLEGLSFSTFPSYNINKNFHPKANNWVGYTLNLNGKTISVVGDSDNTPELQNLKTDILLLPIGGTYTMDAKEAAELTNKICPKIVIPTHYGEIVGDKTMGKQFAALVSGKIDVQILLYLDSK